MERSEGSGSKIGFCSRIFVVGSHSWVGSGSRTRGWAPWIFSVDASKVAGFGCSSRMRGSASRAGLIFLIQQSHSRIRSNDRAVDFDSEGGFGYARGSGDRHPNRVLFPQYSLGCFAGIIYPRRVILTHAFAHIASF